MVKKCYLEGIFDIPEKRAKKVCYLEKKFEF